jgi:hypothetical protein
VFPEARCLWSSARTRRVPPARRGLSRSGNLKGDLKGDLKLKDDTVLTCFLSLFPLPEPAAVEDQRCQRAEFDKIRVQLVVF